MTTNPSDYGPGDVVQCIHVTEACPHCGTKQLDRAWNGIPVVGRYYRCKQVVQARCGTCLTRVDGMLPAELDLGSRRGHRYAWYYPDFRKIESGTMSIKDMIAANSKEPAHV